MTADRTPALIAALNVALKAQHGLLTDGPVAEMMARAEELLEPDHPGRIAALLFATTWRQHRHNAQELAQLGAELQRGVLRAVRPDPVDGQRSDIHG